MHRNIIFGLLVISLLLLICIPLGATETEGTKTWASYIVAYQQGLNGNNSAVAPENSDPSNALGPPDSMVAGQTNFFSLGFGGWLIVGFPHPIANGLGSDLVIIETTWNTYPLESADVYVSQDNYTWTYAGSVDNNYGAEVANEGFVSLPLNLTEVEYIKIVDTTDIEVFKPYNDAYDLDAVGAFYVSKGRMLSIELTGDLDYLWEEEVRIRLATLVKDAFTMEPVSGANVTLRIYYPDGTLWVSDNMTERLTETGIYEWESDKTINQLELPKGVYLVHVQASYDEDPKATGILEFHIDPPPSADLNLLGAAFWCSILIVGIVFGTILVLRVRHPRKNQLTTH